MYRFNHFNQILLSLFDILNTFYYSILVFLHDLTRVNLNINLETRLKCQINLKKN